MRELELALLKCLLIDEKGEEIHYKDLSDSLFTECPDIYRKVVEYRKNDGKFDLILASQSLGVDVVKLLMIQNVSLACAKEYLRTLKQKKSLSSIWEKINRGDPKVEDFEEVIETYKRLSPDSKMYNLDSDLQDYRDDVDKRMAGNTIRYHTGIEDIDKILGYIYPGRFITIGGYSGIGKTNFSLKLFNNLIQNGIKALYFTSEMGYYTLIDRLVAMNSNLSAFNITNGIILGDDLNKFTQTVGQKIAKKPGFIYETGIFDLNIIKDKIRETEAQWIFIDYVQQFALQTVRGFNKADIVEEIAKALKGLAIDKNIVVCGLSQLNKDSELKSSKALEEKSDVVIKLHPKDEENFNMKVINVEVYKNRFGRTGSVEFAFNKINCDFTKLERVVE